MVANFAAGLVVSAGIWGRGRRRLSPSDAACRVRPRRRQHERPSSILAALAQVPATVFFAGGGAVAMVLNAFLAICWWREPHAGLGLAGVGLESLTSLMLNLSGF